MASDLATKCGNSLLSKYNIDPKSIDFLIVCTECPDYLAPSTSCIIQNKMNLSNQVCAFDIALGCSGYTHGLGIAKSLIESNTAKKILFITIDLPTHVIDKKDTELRLLFSDAASASIISSTKKGYEILNPIFGTDGSGQKSLYSENSAFKINSLQTKSEQTLDKLPFGKMVMNGEEILHFALDKVPKLTNKILSKNNFLLDNINLFVYHQASELILKSIQRKLKIPDSKFFTNFNEVGNTVSSSIPIALKQTENNGDIRKNMSILIAGFGIGFSWSGTILKTV